MTEISTILHRRTDLSTFVVHLTRDCNGHSALENLVSIYQANEVEARSAYGWAKSEDDPADPARQSQRVVCFSETPLEHVHLLTGSITLWGSPRSYQLAPYGIALTKMTARRKGINPVWYVDRTVGRTWTISPALNELYRDAVEAGDFHNHPASKILPLIEPMGRWDTNGSVNEWWWEREWRHVGDFRLPSARKIIWLCPEADIDAFRTSTVGHDAALVWIDPKWGLEKIIAHLAGFDDEDVSPFASPPAAAMSSVLMSEARRRRDGGEPLDVNT